MNTVTVTKNSQKTPLQMHLAGECKCSVSANPNGCIYQPFLDGWDFTPDVGFGQLRGEVFTPRVLVDQMIVASGMLPAKAVYQYKYKTRTQKESLWYIQSRVNEPAVGTANFTATILWHKLEYAYQAALTADGLDQVQYDLYATQSLASLYAYDIDCGNLQTTKIRLLNMSDIYTEEAFTYWVAHIRSALNRRYLDDEQRASLEKQVSQSLIAASKNWESKVPGPGVMQQQYLKHTGVEPSLGLKALWAKVLGANFKLFNGISEHDSLAEDFIVPGWHNVKWLWWNFVPDERGHTIPSYTEVPLAKQIFGSRIEKLRAELEEIESRKTIPEGDLLGVSMFENDQDKKQYLAKKKELDQQRVKLLNVASKQQEDPEEIEQMADLARATLF